MKKIALLLTRRAAAASLRFRPSGALRGVVSRQPHHFDPNEAPPFGRYQAFLVVCTSWSESRRRGRSRAKIDLVHDSRGLAITIHSTPSLHGGVVRAMLEWQ